MQLQALYKYPVKALGGISLQACQIGQTGIDGDRRYALLDVETGAVVSRKHPRRFPSLGELSALHDAAERVVIRFPDGSVIGVDDPAVEPMLSRHIGRAVRLISQVPPAATVHRVWPDVPGLVPEQVRAAAAPTDEPGVTAGPLGLLAPGTFFDGGPIHVIFAASQRYLAMLAGGDADAARFRPNLVVGSEMEGAERFIEDDLVGRRLGVGPEVVLELCSPAPRCVVPTLAVGDAPASPELLRALAQHHRVPVAGRGAFACFGLYAQMVRGGEIQVGDAVALPGD